MIRNGFKIKKKISEKRLPIQPKQKESFFVANKEINFFLERGRENILFANNGSRKKSTKGIGINGHKVIAKLIQE